MDKKIESESYWIVSTKDTNYQRLEKDISSEAVVVGAGIAGLTTALLLQESGVPTVLIDSKQIAKGVTAYTTGKITSQHHLIYNDLLNLFGEERALQYANANEAAIKKIYDLCNKYNIDCDLNERDAYVYTNNSEDVDKIEKEVKAAQTLNLPADFVQRRDFPFECLCGIRFKNQAQFHPRKYLLGLAEAFVSLGGTIYENTMAKDIKSNDEENEYPYKVVVDNSCSIDAKYIISATHFPFFNKSNFYFAKTYAQSSYIVAVSSKGPIKDMYITHEKPIRSLRNYYSTDIDDMVLIGGESCKTGISDETTHHYDNLYKYYLSIDENAVIKYRWMTQDYITIDRVPYIGSINKKYKNIFVATGFNKWGMTTGTVSGMIIRDIIVNGNSPWSDVFDPSRNLDFVKVKNLITNGAGATYELIKGKIQSHNKSFNDLKKNEGRIIKVNNDNVGIYKDENGKVYAFDITCPHMKCELAWNNAEKTWDCPCHGSRFNCRGEVIDGPAMENLKEIDLDFLRSFNNNDDK